LTAKPKGPRHHSCRAGKLVRVALHDGTVIMGRFKEKNRRYCLLRDFRRIPWREVRSFGIARRVVQQSNPISGTE